MKHFHVTLLCRVPNEEFPASMPVLDVEAVDEADAEAKARQRVSPMQVVRVETITSRPSPLSR